MNRVISNSNNGPQSISPKTPPFVNARAGYIDWRGTSGLSFTRPPSPQSSLMRVSASPASSLQYVGTHMWNDGTTGSYSTQKQPSSGILTLSQTGIPYTRDSLPITWSGRALPPSTPAFNARQTIYTGMLTISPQIPATHALNVRNQTQQ
jgi:hypothetical protein